VSQACQSACALAAACAPAVVALLAATPGLPVFELAVRELELEQIFLDLVAELA